MTDEELAGIEKRWAAATKGPWFWQVNQNAKCVTLWGSASMVVMDFVRWGFNKATPRFRDYRDIMEKAEEFAYRIEGREHHSDWCKQITHPDAVAIQSAPNDVSSLIAEVRRLKKIIGYIESEHARATGLHVDGTANYSLRGIVGEGTSIEDAVSRKCRI